MFTGLIQAVGQVRHLNRDGHAGRLTIASRMAAADLALGESIAVNGVCLTVVHWDNDSFVLDVSPETLRSTTLGHLSPGEPVNLERALRLGDRLGGHLVSGHIDSIATVRQRRQDHNAVTFEFSTSAEAMRYIVPKGSIAIDGISLTVNRVFGDRFGVSIIPHSLNATTLKDRRIGDSVNVETDLIGRYVERLLGGRQEARERESIDTDFLAKNGFL